VVFQRYSLRSMRQRPGRTILTVLSIVIGVAATVAVTLVTHTTRSAYDLMFATVRGKAALEVSSSAAQLIEESLVEKIVTAPGVEAVAPVIQRFSSMSVRGKRVRLQVLGIDPRRDGVIRERELVAGTEWGTGDDLLIEEHFARQLDVKIGDRVTLLGRAAARPRPFQVVGFVKLKGSAAIRQSGLVFLAMPRAQSLFLGKNVRKFDSIQIVLRPGFEVADVKQAITPLLPEGFEAHPPATDSNILQETLLATQEGLQLATLFSLLLAAFLILNTFLMNVGERRRQFAILRAIGATRRQVTGLLIRESLLFGVLGTCLGIGVGIGLAWALNETLADVLDVALPSIAPALRSPRPYVLAAIFGLVISVCGALAPALRAGKVSPLEGLNRVAPEDVRGLPLSRIVLGVLLIASSSAVIYAGIVGWIDSDLPTFASVFLLIGIVLLIPLVLAPLSQLVVVALRPVVGVEASLAQKQLLRHRGRTSLTVGVLFVAGSTGIGIAHSVIDNVNDVKDWYRRTIIGDYYVRALMPDFSTGLNADLPVELDRDLRRVPGIANLDRVKLMTQGIRRPQSAATQSAGETGGESAEPDDLKVIAVVREFHEPGRLPLDILEGDESTLRSQMEAGGVVLGNILANKLGAHPGDRVVMSTVDGDQELLVAAVTNDYMVGGLSVYFEWSAAEKLFEIPGADAYVIRAAPGELAALRDRLEQLTNQYGVLLQSSADIRQLIDRMILGIDGCLWGLIFLGFIVAGFGVVNTLSMNVLEQTRELGLLRVVAMTRRQARRAVLIQAVIIGLVGLAPGIASGNAIAYLINLATKPAIGRVIEFGFHPELLFGTLVAAFAITLLGAYLPARRASSVELASALHYE
jgi:putative ABC transport system permease protein